MTMLEIDEALAAWRSRLTAIADNLLWLQNDSTYKMLSGSGATHVRAAGATARRVDPALAPMQTIFERFSVLQTTIERADELRRSMPALFGAEQRLAEIRHVLFGRSIQLAVSAAPSAQRSLLSGAQGVEQRTPDEVLAAMVTEFATARDAVLAVEHAWRDLAEGVDRAEDQIQRFPANAQSGIQRNLQEIRDSLGTDPLGALDNLRKRVEPELARFSRMAAAAAKTRQDLEQAHARLDQLVALHREILAAEAEAKAKVAGFHASSPPAGEERFKRLREWLHQLDLRCTEGASANVETGLRNWNKGAEELASEESRARAAIQTALETRRELRGRLDALKAKARAWRVAEHAEMSDLARQGEQLLTTRPTNLEHAAAAVALYATMLNAKKMQKRGSE
ncbi:hypothetical protein SAMN05421770_11329 [Granulicella rosea]|uniref:Uncharacterized protein n=1 Tax=Granulicella rosea TaxID=474952 RepID=A0A239MHM9_9BACT|nr:hypothetical protein [Granulicella rosea]SNT42151.1 hypothetical protein SAMN05421770_11329 [Granulicella rosea]